jgi:porin
MRPLIAVVVAGVLSCSAAGYGQRVAISPGLTGDVESGSDRNIEREIGEAEVPLKVSLLPVDRPVREQWMGMKDRLKTSIGLEFALESTLIYQATSGSRGPNEAAVSTTKLSGLWMPWKSRENKDGIAIGFAGETRQNFSGASFVDMRESLGTLWSPNDATSDDYVTLTQLWFGQRTFNEKLVYLIGKIDPGSYINGNRFAGSGNTQFFSQPFATNPARPWPSNGIGAMGRFIPVNWFYVQGTVSDGDAVNTHSPFTSIQGHWLFATEAVFKPNLPGLGEGNYRFMVYTRDTEAQNTAGWSLSFDQNLGEELGVFLRYDSNDGRVSAISQLISGGVAFLKPFGRVDDQAGIGVSFAHPSNPDLRDEYSAEAYYRVQLTDFLEFSTSAQAVVHPATAAEEVIGVFGVRFRVLF